MYNTCFQLNFDEFQEFQVKMTKTPTFLKIEVQATYIPQKKGKMIQKLISWQKSMKPQKK